MRKFSCFCWLIILFGSSFAQTSGEFTEPWKKSNIAIALDPFHGNSIDWEQLATDKRVAGIIHKAVQGKSKDPKYAERRTIAKQRNYKWGSYHLLTTADPIEQAKFYLATVGASDDEILAVDVECTVATTDCGSASFKVKLEDVKKFIVHIKKETGRYPLVYCNNAVTKEISTKYKGDEIFSKVPLWYARFVRKEVTDFPKGVWTTYSFWQFSSEINCNPQINCLYRVPGTKTDMDVNVYNGTVEELRNNWAQIGK